MHWQFDGPTFTQPVVPHRSAPSDTARGGQVAALPKWTPPRKNGPEEPQPGTWLRTSDFAARKLCHAGCGFLMMLLDPADAHSRWFVWSVAAGSIAMTWSLTPLPAFRFARARDVGVTACALSPPPRP